VNDTSTLLAASGVAGMFAVGSDRRGDRAAAVDGDQFLRRFARAG